MCNVLRDHGLAEALSRGEDDVSGLGQEVESEHGLDEGSVDLGWPAPVEVGHGLEALEPATLDAPVETTLGAVLFFERGDVLEELEGTEALLSGQGDQIVEPLGGRGESEGAQDGSEVTRGHGRTCFSGESAESPRRS